MLIVVREAIILAAGLGSRLWGVTGGKPKFLVKVRGIPLIYYPLISLVLAGVSRFVIVIPRGWSRRVLRLIGKLPFDVDIDLVVVRNYEVERENGYSLLLGAEFVKGKFFVLSMSDHIYVPEIPRKLISIVSRFPKRALVAIGADRRPLFVDVGEATKIKVERGRYVLRVGKNLDDFDFIDSGVFLMSSKLLRVRDKLLEKRTLGVSDVINEVIRMGYRVLAIDITGYPWTEVDTPEDLDEVRNGIRSVVVREFLKRLEVLRYGIR